MTVINSSSVSNLCGHNQCLQSSPCVFKSEGLYPHSPIGTTIKTMAPLDNTKCLRCRSTRSSSNLIGFAFWMKEYTCSSSKSKGPWRLHEAHSDDSSLTCRSHRHGHLSHAWFAEFTVGRGSLNSHTRRKSSIVWVGQPVMSSSLLSPLLSYTHLNHLGPQKVPVEIWRLEKNSVYSESYA